MRAGSAQRDAHGLFCRRLWVVAMLQVDDELELAIGSSYVADGPVRLAEQVMRQGVRRIHPGGAIKIVKSRDGLIELEKGFAEQNIRACGGGL